MSPSGPRDDDPLWYKDAVIYQLHVKAFRDANADGVGDFKGLTSKLDYLESLGVNALWILPFYPSPLKDDGYDIADYSNVHPNYGTVADFREFLRQAHRRGLRVITELVLNHTSDQHAWFQRARRAAPKTSARDFYVWSDTAKRYEDARIIFQDFESSNWTWDSVADAYFWHRFYKHQPDLNFDNPAVHKALFKVFEFWMRMGVDGMRLDAVPYLYEREGTNCENLPETYDFLRKLRAQVDAAFPGKMLLAEANQWPEDAVAYFGGGDMCQMAFHFPLMPRMFMALQMEDRYPIIDILRSTPAIPDNCQWAMFLRNHDELTLEMVTDEERDYMYRMYARDPQARINLGIRRRLAPLLGFDRRKIELMNILLFTMPGSPVVYYGDEIGMGDNFFLGDRNGVRTPMQWSGDRNAGFSDANPQRLYLPPIIDPECHFESINVVNQEQNPASLLWWMRRLIALRRDHRAFGRGLLSFLYPDNSKVLAYVRELGDEIILVVVNLSRHPQAAELDLSAHLGCCPRELFSMTAFPPVREGPYRITLGSYGYFLFRLGEKRSEAREIGDVAPELELAPPFAELFADRAAVELLENRIIPRHLATSRWFAGKARTVSGVRVLDAVPVGLRSALAQVVVFRVEYVEAEPETYCLPMTFATDRDAVAKLEAETPRAIIAKARLAGEHGVIHDAMFDPRFLRNLMTLVTRRRSVHGETGARGRLLGNRGRILRELMEDSGVAPSDLSPELMPGEQSNTTAYLGDQLILKLYRKLEDGPQPEVEISRHLTERTPFTNTPSFAGLVEYRRSGAEPTSLAIVHRFVPNQGTAWSNVIDAVKRFYERVLTMQDHEHEIVQSLKLPAVTAMADMEVPVGVEELLGSVYFEMARLFGRRTAEMHLALASDREDPAFRPEPFQLLYQRSLYQGMQTSVRRTMELLGRRLDALPDQVRELARATLGQEKRILATMRNISKRKIEADRIRIHGDYHLGQALYTGKDFMIIDFEGEPGRAIGVRRLKRSALRDVAGMIRSFHYAVCQVLYREGVVRPEDTAALEPWAELWYKFASGSFMRGYFDAAGQASFLPLEREQRDMMLQVFLLDKAVYEIAYELNNRPDWLVIPLRSVNLLLEESS